ncbi:hypothetical protein [Thiocystis violacea]|uniref:hypothetical protein n=1 Tax=Thiocystis violacea TaxID=13725 RepID=UPI001907EEBC|nr:hypothetical protein [Thiocystis violacea]MBK1720153.1 hypothetical protein [Thiocystis violacea]
MTTILAEAARAAGLEVLLLSGRGDIRQDNHAVATVTDGKRPADYIYPARCRICKMNFFSPLTGGSA